MNDTRRVENIPGTVEGDLNYLANWKIYDKG